MTEIDIFAGKPTTWDGPGDLYDPHQATDGFPLRRALAVWAVVNSTRLEVDLGASFLIHALIIRQLNASALELFGSNDGIAYTSIEAFTTPDEYRDIRHDLTDNVTAYRYYRLFPTEMDDVVWSVYTVQGLTFIETGQQSNERFLAYDNFMQDASELPIASLTSGQDWWQNGSALVGQFESTAGEIPPQWFSEHSFASATNCNGPPQDHLFALVDVARADYLLDAFINTRTYDGYTGLIFRAERDVLDSVTGLMFEFKGGVFRLIELNGASRSTLVTKADFPYDGTNERLVIGVSLHEDWIVCQVDGNTVFTYQTAFQEGATLCGLSFFDGTISDQQAVLDVYARPHIGVSYVCGKMDVAFLIDTTGSMGAAIEGIKSGIEEVMDDIEASSGNDYRLALVQIGENVSSPFNDQVRVDVQFADNNRIDFVAALALYEASSGGDIPEASDEAVRTAIFAMLASERNPGEQVGDFTPGFRDAALKIIVLVTDAVPGGFDDAYTHGVDNVNAHDRAVEAGVRGIRIAAIEAYDFSHGDALNSVMQEYATLTGGLYWRLPPLSAGTAGVLRRVIALCGGTVVNVFSFGTVIGA